LFVYEKNRTLKYILLVKYASRKMEDNIVLLIVVFDAMEIIRSVNSKEIVVNLFLCMN
jgi:hypothetical protein